jgi:plastocyanin
MRRLVASLATIAGLAALSAVPSTAGPDKIRFPAGYRDHVLYTIVDRHDIKRYHEIWGTGDAVAAMKAGRPLPSGSVLTNVQFKAQVDAAGNPIKGPNGRFVKGDLVAYGVMEKRAGWGTEYPMEWRNGEWEFASFGADMKLNEKANYKACFECHKPHEKTDFVISLTKLVPPVAASNFGATPATTVVSIDNFKFGPAKLTVDKNIAVMWTNADDSPHQVTVTTGAVTRSAVLSKGARHTQAFATPGVYDYMCGLHPAMKGQIEVK